MLLKINNRNKATPPGCWEKYGQTRKEHHGFVNKINLNVHTTIQKKKIDMNHHKIRITDKVWHQGYNNDNMRMESWEKAHRSRTVRRCDKIRRKSFK